jgi:hypothetical protein
MSWFRHNPRKKIPKPRQPYPVPPPPLPNNQTV